MYEGEVRETKGSLSEPRTSEFGGTMSILMYSVLSVQIGSPLLDSLNSAIMGSNVH